MVYPPVSGSAGGVGLRRFEHRLIVDRLIERGLLGAHEVGSIIVDRAQPAHESSQEHAKEHAEQTEPTRESLAENNH